MTSPASPRPGGGSSRPALGAIGNMDDARAHVEALSAAGADTVALFPSTDIDTARRQLDDVAVLVS